MEWRGLGGEEWDPQHFPICKSINDKTTHSHHFVFHHPLFHPVILPYSYSCPHPPDSFLTGYLLSRSPSPSPLVQLIKFKATHIERENNILSSFFLPLLIFCLFLGKINPLNLHLHLHLHLPLPRMRIRKRQLSLPFSSLPLSSDSDPLPPVQLPCAAPHGGDPSPPPPHHNTAPVSPIKYSSSCFAFCFPHHLDFRFCLIYFTAFFKTALAKQTQKTTFIFFFTSLFSMCVSLQIRRIIGRTNPEIQMSLMGVVGF